MPRFAKYSRAVSAAPESRASRSLPRYRSAVAILEVLQEPPAAADHLEQTVAGVLVLLVLLEMFGELVDSGAEQRNLHRRRAGVVGVQAKLVYEFALGVRVMAMCGYRSRRPCAGPFRRGGGGGQSRRPDFVRCNARQRLVNLVLGLAGRPRVARRMLAR